MMENIGDKIWAVKWDWPI